MERFLFKGITPIKIVLAALFFLLGIGEFLDGIYDVGDYAVPMFIVLILNDIYIQFTEGKKQKLMLYSDLLVKPTPSIELYPKKLKSSFKVLMNVLFFVMFFSPFLFEVIGLSASAKNDVFKVLIILWSGGFLTVSVKSLSDSFAPKKVFFCNVALLLFVGSFFLI